MFSFVVPLICHLSILLWRGLWAEQLDHPKKMSTTPWAHHHHCLCFKMSKQQKQNPGRRKKAVVPDIDEKNKNSR